MEQFIPRLTAPAKNDPNYFANNPYYKNGYGMPNCTCYAEGRILELTGEIPKGLHYGNAENWYVGTKDVPKGSTPKLGATICWAKGKLWDGSDGAGHVATVEDIYEDGTILCSNSAYKGTYFYLSKHKPPYNLKNYTFQGFIYSTIEWGKIEIVKPQTRDTSIPQLQVDLDYLRCRVDAGLDKTILGYVEKNGIYAYTNTKEANGFTWYEIAENQWVGDDNTLTVLPVEIKPEPTPEPEFKFKENDRVVINGPLYRSSTAAEPSGRVINKITTITRRTETKTPHPYNTTGDLGWMNESDITLYVEPEFKVKDKVVPVVLKDYRGISLVQYDPFYIISSINGDKATLMARGQIWATMFIKDISHYNK